MKYLTGEQQRILAGICLLLALGLVVRWARAGQVPAAAPRTIVSEHQP